MQLAGEESPRRRIVDAEAPVPRLATAPYGTLQRRPGGMTSAFAVDMSRYLGLTTAVVLACVGCQQAEPCPPDVPIDPAGAVHTYVVDHVDLPRRADEATKYGLSLDCDPRGVPDNALGQVLAAVFSLADVDVGAEVATLIDSGRLLHLLQVQATGLDSADGVGVTLLHGLDLDGDPTDNFNGTESFAVDASRGRGTTSGSIVDHQLVAAHGDLPLAIALPEVDEPFVLHLFGARIEASIAGDRLEGRIGGAVGSAEVDNVLIPIWTRGLSLAVARDCRDGTCTSGSFGELLLEAFDRDHDGAVSERELRESELVAVLLAPDVDLLDANGALAPGRDGVPDGLSFGVGFTAVPAMVAE